MDSKLNCQYLTEYIAKCETYIIIRFCASQNQNFKKQPELFLQQDS